MLFKKKRRKTVTILDIEKIREMRKQGKSIDEIAREINRTPRAVYNIIHRAKIREGKLESIKQLATKEEELRKSISSLERRREELRKSVSIKEIQLKEIENGLKILKEQKSAIVKAIRGEIERETIERLLSSEDFRKTIAVIEAFRLFTQSKRI